MVPPRIIDVSSGLGDTETLGQYARRIRLSDHFLDWYSAKWCDAGGAAKEFREALDQLNPGKI